MQPASSIQQTRYFRQWLTDLLYTILSSAISVSVYGAASCPRNDYFLSCFDLSMMAFRAGISFACLSDKEPSSKFGIAVEGTIGAMFARPRRNETKTPSVWRFPQRPTKARAPVSPLYP